jgi:hypothetical protein
MGRDLAMTPAVREAPVADDRVEPTALGRALTGAGCQGGAR